MSLQSVELPAFNPATSRKPRSLFHFLAWRGGLKPHADLRAIFDTRNPFVPGLGKLIRKTGMSLDTAREACVEESFLQDNECREHEPSINDLLELIAAEAAGQKQYRMHEAIDAYEHEAASALTRAGHVTPAGKPAKENPPAQHGDTNMPESFMSATKYKQLRGKIGISNYALRKKLGVSLRAVYRYENAEQEIPEPVAKLLIMFAKHGIPKDF